MMKKQKSKLTSWETSVHLGDPGTPTAPFPTGTGVRGPGRGGVSAVHKSLLPQKGQNTAAFLEISSAVSALKSGIGG